MLTPFTRIPKPTELQLKYLNALRDGKKLGKQVRGRLRRWGVRGSKGAFYRIMKRLKDDGLVKSERIPKGLSGHQRQEVFYELTNMGNLVVGPTLELVNGGESRVVGLEFRKQIERARACLG